MPRSLIYAIAGLAGALAAFGKPAAAITSSSSTPIGRIIALPPAPQQADPASEPMRFADNSSSNSSRNSSGNRGRNWSNNYSNNWSNNSSNNSSDEHRGKRRWRYRYH